MKKIILLMFALFACIGIGHAQYGCGNGVAISDGYTANNITSPGTGGAEDWNAPNPSDGCGVSEFYWDDDVYLFTYTAGANDEEISMSIFSRSSWNGLGIFATCTGTALDGCIDTDANTAANTAKTVTTTISAGQTVYLAVGQWGTPNNLDFDVTAFSATAIVSAPSCTVLNTPISAATDVSENSDLAWDAATGGATGYFLSVGTTTGGTDIVNNFDNGLSLTYDLPVLNFSTTYYVTISPYNGNGTAMGCTEESFTTRAAPPAGEVCSNPLIVASLPFNTSDDTANYVDDYDGSPGANCGSTSGYLDGDDVVYSYTATADATLSYDLSAIGDNYAGMFLYNECADIGTSCIAGATNGFSSADLNFEFNVVNGETYYLVISTWAAPQTTTYTLDITEILCADPSDLAASNISTTSADLSWTDNGSTATPNWNIEIVSSGATPTNTATDTATTNSFMATALTPNTAYDYYVQADCGAGATSAWIGPFTFTTACNALTAPYNEDFENGGALPACWSLGGDDTWVFNTAGPNHVGNAGTITGSTASNGYYAVVDDSDPTSTNASLTSPFVDLSPLTTPALTFYEISDNEGNANATLTVEVWDGAAWNTVGTYNTNTSGWEQKIIDLSGLTFTGPAQVRFLNADSGSFYDDIAIDDVSFEELPACIAPSTFTVTNTTTTSSDFSWVENNGSTVWEIVVQAPGTGIPAGAGTQVMTTPTYTDNTLSATTAYEAYVRTDCGGGTFSDWVGPLDFFTAPSNDECAEAIALTPGLAFGDNAIVGTNVGATDSAGIPAPGCASYNGSDVWFSVVVPNDGNITLEVNTETGGIGDTGGAVYSGTCGALVLEACNDDGSANGAHPIISIANPALANETIFFRVWEFGGNAEGAFRVSAYSATLGTDSFNSNEIEFNFYPNPVKNDLTIETKSDMSSVAIYNLLGQTVKTMAPNSSNAIVDMSQLSKGAYFVKVVSGNSTKTIRVIKD